MGVTVKDGITSPLESLRDEVPRAYIRAIKSLGGYFRNKLMRSFKKGQVGDYKFAPLNPITLKLREGRRSSVRRIRKNIKKAAAEAGVSFRDVRKSKAWKNTNRRLRHTIGFGGRIPELSRYAVSDDPSQIVRFGFLGDLVPNIDVRALRYQEQRAARPWSKPERQMLHMIYEFPRSSDPAPTAKKAASKAEKRRSAKPPLPFDQYARPERQTVGPILPEVEKETDAVLAKAINRLEAYYNKKGWASAQTRATSYLS